LNNDYILEDSSDFFNLMAQMSMPTIQTSSFVDMLACSDEVQSSSASFVASQQLQTQQLQTCTRLKYHFTVFTPVKILILFNKAQQQWQ